MTPKSPIVPGIIGVPWGGAAIEALLAKQKKVKKENKVGKVMEEFKEGELRSGSKKGPIVANKKQAVAIAMSEARRKAIRGKKK